MLCFFYLDILKYNLFLWCKAEFSALLQSSVSHDPSEIILICWSDTQLLIVIAAQLLLMVHIIINVKNGFAAL